jgi:septal ring factor EnvC (AmiA/AmiB activator)
MTASQRPIIPDSLVSKVDPVVQFIAARLDAFNSDIQEIKGVQKEMAASFTKLIVIEERQTATMAGLERAFKALERMDTKLEAYTSANRETCQALEKENTDLAKRVVELEKSEPMQAQTSKWVVAAVWGSLALLAGFLVPRILERLLT